MKKESKVWISEIRARLQVYARTSDPEAFEDAWYMWRTYCLRHGLHTMAFFSHTRKKGWLKLRQIKEKHIDLAEFEC